MVSVTISIFFTNTQSNKHNDISQIFFIEGIFYESLDHVEIYFIDKSGHTKTAVLEILGMRESFQKIYVTNEFTETVPFFQTPKYGWKIHPIVLLVEHDKYGTIQLKTEIHLPNEPVPPVIFSRP